MTSTRVPGPTNPATWMTSSTRMLTARMPSGITIGRPPPASLTAIFAGMSGSFIATFWIRPRPRTSSTEDEYPSGTASPGHWETLMSATSRMCPTGRSRDATTTSTDEAVLVLIGLLGWRR